MNNEGVCRTVLATSGLVIIILGTRGGGLHELTIQSKILGVWFVETLFQKKVGGGNGHILLLITGD